MKKKVFVIYSVKRFAVSMTAGILLLSAVLGFGFFHLAAKDGSTRFQTEVTSVAYSVMKG